MGATPPPPQGGLISTSIVCWAQNGVSRKEEGGGGVPSPFSTGVTPIVSAVLVVYLDIREAQQNFVNPSPTRLPEHRGSGSKMTITTHTCSPFSTGLSCSSNSVRQTKGWGGNVAPTVSLHCFLLFSVGDQRDGSAEANPGRDPRDAQTGLAGDEPPVRAVQQTDQVSSTPPPFGPIHTGHGGKFARKKTEHYC